MLPEILTDFIKWNLSWKVWVLPRASYEVDSVPSLRWHFDGHVLVTVTLELDGFIGEPHKSVGNTGEIQASGQSLGTVFLGPREWAITGTFTTPVALIRMLVEGELEAPGISVTERWQPFTTFSIQGLEEEIEVCDDFVAFIRNMGKKKSLAEALLEQGIIDEATAQLLEEKWDLPLNMGNGPHSFGFESAAAVNKLMELGMSESDAKKAIENSTIPNGSTAEEIVGIVLAKS